ncbi:MAG: hypothetical protein P4M09_06575 [Devosia sp.]|nr:hypothetical protein [Devosia sp.]
MEVSLSERNSSDRLEAAMESIDESKRTALRKLVVATAFVAPVVASFAIDGMMVSSALAAAPNSGNSGV